MIFLNKTVLPVFVCGGTPNKFIQYTIGFRLQFKLMLLGMIRGLLAAGSDNLLESNFSFGWTLFVFDIFSTSSLKKVKNKTIIYTLTHKSFVKT